MHKEVSGQEADLLSLPQGGVRAAAGLGVLLATLPCSPLVPEKLCAMWSLMLEKPHGPHRSLLCHNQEASLPRHISSSLYRQNPLTRATGKYI